MYVLYILGLRVFAYAKTRPVYSGQTSCLLLGYSVFFGLNCPNPKGHLDYPHKRCGVLELPFEILSNGASRVRRVMLRDILERCFETASTYASRHPRTMFRDSLEVCFNASADYAATVKALLNLPVLSVLPDLLPSSIFVRTSM